MAQHWSIIIFAELRPNQEDSIDVERLLSSAAKLILLSRELVSPENRKDRKYEDNEEEDAH